MDRRHPRGPEDNRNKKKPRREDNDAVSSVASAAVSARSVGRHSGNDDNNPRIRDDYANPSYRGSYEQEAEGRRSPYSRPQQEGSYYRPQDPSPSEHRGERRYYNAPSWGQHGAADRRRYFQPDQQPQQRSRQGSGGFRAQQQQHLPPSYQFRGGTSWNLAERRRVEQNGLRVQTNALQVRVKQPPNQGHAIQQQHPLRLCWYIYRLVIFPVRRVLRRPEPSTATAGPPSYTFEKIPLPTTHSDDESLGDSSPVYRTIDNSVRSPLTQQICLAWASQVSQFKQGKDSKKEQSRQLVIADGSEIALSLQPILAESSSSIGKAYDIALPRGSTRDDPEEPYMDKQFFRVEVYPYHGTTASSEHNQEITQWNAALNTVLHGRLQILEDYLTTALRWACLEARLLCFGRNPVHSYLPMPMQLDPSILGTKNTHGDRKPPPRRSSYTTVSCGATVRPAVAFHATACVTQDQSLIVKANLLMNHILPDRMQSYLTPRKLKGRIPLLDAHARTIAGIHVPNIHEMITSPEIRDEIVSKLKQLVLEIRYEKSLEHGDWIETMKKENKTQEWLEKHKWMIRKKKRLYKQEIDSMIVWDPSTYTFEWKGKNVTVLEYFEANYGIILQYPKMPLVRIGRLERLPAELLFQGVALATFHKDAAEARAEDRLKFYDTFPGSQRLVHIERVSKESGLLGTDSDVGTIQEALSRLGLGIDTDRIKLTAEVLRPPELVFDRAAKESFISDGSWRILNRRFLRGSQFYSFAVIRSSPDIADPELRTLFDELQTAFKNTGIQTAFSRPMTEFLGDNIVEVDARTALPLDWDKTVQEAQQKCWRKFYGQSTGVALVRHCWGETFSGGNSVGTVKECVLIPNPQETERGQFLAIPTDKGSKFLFSNTVERYFVQPEYFYLTGGSSLPGDRIRDIRWDSELSCLILLPEKCRVSVKAMVFKEHGDANPSKIVRALDKIFPIVTRRNVSHPTIIFLLCSGSLGSGHYNEIKWACEQRGLQSQIVRMDKFREACRRRTGPRAYVSNLTLKLNGKASDSLGRATAWSVPELEDLTSGMMVFGLTMSFGSGVSGKMVVCGTCMLGGNSIRFGHSAMIQDKDHIIEGKLLREMVKNLYQQWRNQVSNQQNPKRILVYRSSGNETDFKDIVEEEVNSIRSVFPGTAPPITFVVAQNNHNLVLAPDDSYYSQRNVPGGTSLRAPSILPRTYCVQTADGIHDTNRMDFFLTAHEGLKGTSKPILYRCLVNEVGTFSNTLDRNTLRRVTYLMSFQYGTATKAVREVAVLRYSARQAKRMHSVLERLVDQNFQNAPTPGLRIHPKFDTDSGKRVYSWSKQSEDDSGSTEPPPSFDFLDAFGGRDENGRLQFPFYTNLAM